MFTGQLRAGVHIMRDVFSVVQRGLIILLRSECGALASKTSRKNVYQTSAALN